jgi:hypothetical protein
VPIQKRHFSPDFCVGQQIQVLEILTIFLRFGFVARLELGRDSPFLDGHYLAEKWIKNNGASAPADGAFANGAWTAVTWYEFKTKKPSPRPGSTKSARPYFPIGSWPDEFRKMKINT